MDMKLILLRGPSGTGKSTIANTLSASCHETDNFFVNEKGVYSFEASLITRAHKWNQQEVRKKMLCKAPLVIVSNTFIKHWEMSPYLNLAKELGYDVKIIRTPGPWQADVLFKRNKHNVPFHVIQRQINSFQPHKDEYVWEDMSVFK